MQVYLRADGSSPFRVWFDSLTRIIHADRDFFRAKDENCAHARCAVAPVLRLMLGDGCRRSGLNRIEVVWAAQAPRASRPLWAQLRCELDDQHFVRTSAREHDFDAA